MVCCVLTAAILATIGRFLRRVRPGGGRPSVARRPPAPVHRADDSAAPVPEPAGARA